MSFIGATGLDEHQENYDELNDKIDANASYINTLVGIPDPTHLPLYGINILNPGLYGLVERAEVNIRQLQTQGTGQGTTISGIETTISGIETEVSGIQSEILGIQGEITGIDSTISSIEFVQLPALGTALTALIGATDVIAVDARNKANRALDIWDYSGDNVYHKKAGNVGIGNTFGSTLTNKLEVNGNINIPTGSTFRIGDQPFNYSHLAGEQPVSSKWTNATDVATNIYYNTGNVGIGVTTAINNKMEVAGNLNISAGSKYKINNVNLTFSDLGGTLSYNSLTDKPTLFDGNYNSLTNKLTGGTNIQILNGVINNTYTLPTAGVGSGGTLGGVRVDNSTIFINGSGVISSTGGTPQVNSDWNETNTSLKSFILNKPTIVNSRWSKTGNEISYNDGNVGIGTADPFRSLHIHKFGISQEVGLILSDDASTTTAGGNRGFHLIKASDNNGYLWNFEDKDLLFATNGTERMRINNLGNVGIGTTDPVQSLLHLHKTATTQKVSIALTDGTTTTAVNRGLQIIKGTDGNGNLYNYENKDLIFGTNGTERMRINNLGNVGIGTTTPFSTAQKTMKLDVNGNVYAGNNSYYLSDHTGTASSQFFGKQYITTILAGMEIENTTLGGNYSQKLHFHTHTYAGSHGRRMTISEGGNVGIGTINPQRQLHVQTHMRIGGSGPVIDFGDDFNVQIYRNGTTNEMRFTTNGTDRMIIYNDASIRTPTGGAFIGNALIARGGGFDIRSICTVNGMYIEMGNEATFTAHYFRMGAYDGLTLIESNSNRSIFFRIWNGVFTGLMRAWEFNQNGGSYNNFNTVNWQQASDHRIKENIVKADLKKCYDNVKNINLYRYNYIDSFQTSKQDKNKLGYIAQEVKRHFPKAVIIKKERLTDKREIPDLLTIDTEQINLSLYGAVKQLIKIVEKQNKRIKTLETLLNIDDNDDVENDAGEAYERIHDEEEVDIDTIEPTEPEQDRAPEPSVSTEPPTEEEIEEINVD